MGLITDEFKKTNEKTVVQPEKKADFTNEERPKKNKKYKLNKQKSKPKKTKNLGTSLKKHGKKIIKIVVLIAVTATLTVSVYNTVIQEKALKDLSKSEIENEFGCVSTKAEKGIFNKINENNFILVPMKNYKRNRLNKLKDVFTDCYNKKISTGIIIETEAENLAEAYNEVDYIKDIINEVNKNNTIIDMPVCINFKEVTSNKKLTPDQMKFIIMAIIDKLEENGVYVVVTGSLKDIEFLKGFMDEELKERDICIDSRFNNKSKNLSGDSTGIYYCNNNLSEIIVGKGLNSTNNYIDDKTIIIDSIEELDDIAMANNLSVYDLLEYNHLKEKDISVGTEIVIPNSYTK